VDEVIRYVDALNRATHTVRVEQIACDDLGADTCAPGEHLRPPREAADALAALLEGAQEPAADVAGRAGKEDQARD